MGSNTPSVYVSQDRVSPIESALYSALLLQVCVSQEVLPLLHPLGSAALQVFLFALWNVVGRQ